MGALSIHVELLLNLYLAVPPTALPKLIKACALPVYFNPVLIVGKLDHEEAAFPIVAVLYPIGKEVEPTLL